MWKLSGNKQASKQQEINKQANKQQEINKQTNKQNVHIFVLHFRSRDISVGFHDTVLTREKAAKSLQ